MTPLWTPLPGERRVLYSPAWFVPYDDWRRRPLAAGFTVALDRWDGAAWLATTVAATRTPSGFIAYPGLGRRREPATAEPELYRARFESSGFRALYPDLTAQEPFAADRVGKEFLAYPYDDTQPPAITVQPEPVPLLPGVAYPYPPGTRLVRGAVRTATGAPVANALVEAAGVSADDGSPWRERTLSDVDGAYRLSLRFPGTGADGGRETFRLVATERPGRTGELAIRLPDDLTRTNVIEIADQ